MRERSTYIPDNLCGSSLRPSALHMEKIFNTVNKNKPQKKCRINQTHIKSKALENQRPTQSPKTKYQVAETLTFLV